jgi:DNA repair exonuclease SbcCD ATPase subunit
LFASAADLDTLASIREKRDEVASERDRLAQKVQEITSERDRVAGLLVDGQAAQERLKEELQREVTAKEGAVKQAADAAQEKADLEVKAARLEKALEARSASLAQAEAALEKERGAALQFAREMDEAFERKSSFFFSRWCFSCSSGVS